MTPISQYSKFLLARTLRGKLPGWSVVAGEPLSGFVTASNSPTDPGDPVVPGSTLIEMNPSSGLVIEWFMKHGETGSVVRPEDNLVSISQHKFPVGGEWSERLVNLVVEIVEGVEQ